MIKPVVPAKLAPMSLGEFSIYFAIALAVCVAIVCFLMVLHAGYFAKPPVRFREVEPFHFAFSRHKAPYQKIPHCVSSLTKKLTGAGIPEASLKYGLGVYFDSPKSLKKGEDPRFWIGFVISSNEPVIDRIRNIPKVHLNFMPKTRVICSQYPFRNFLSPMLLPTKVYPRLHQFAVDNDIPLSGPALEFYIEGRDRRMQIEFVRLLETPMTFGSFSHEE